MTSLDLPREHLRQLARAGFALLLLASAAPSHAAAAIYRITGDLVFHAVKGKFSVTVDEADLTSVLTEDQLIPGPASTLPAGSWFGYDILTAEVTLGSVALDETHARRNSANGGGPTAKLYIEGAPIGPKVGKFLVSFQDCPRSADLGEATESSSGQGMFTRAYFNDGVNKHIGSYRNVVVTEMVGSGVKVDLGSAAASAPERSSLLLFAAVLLVGAATLRWIMMRKGDAVE